VDFGPLAALTNLTSVSVWLCSFRDLSPLAELTNLTSLALFENQIVDISPLTGLTNLRCLSLGRDGCYGNHVSELAPLASLAGLEDLDLSHNCVSDISALAELPNLEYLRLFDNLIENIGPLLDCRSIGTLKHVDLAGNPLSQQALCSDIPALENLLVPGTLPGVRFSGKCEGRRPRISAQPCGGVVTAGDSYTFSTDVLVLPVQVCLWRKDGHSLIHTYGWPGPFYSDQPSFTISPVTHEDTGWYTCMVADENGWTISEPAYLQVLPKGDVDGSGSVDATDVQLVINAALSLEVPPGCDCDVDNSGAVDATDIQLVINAALGVD